MPRGRLTKVDMLAKVFKMKNELYQNSHMRSQEWQNGAHAAINKIIDCINEYSS